MSVRSVTRGLLYLLTAGAAAAAVAVVFVDSGAYDVAADQAPSPVEEWLLHEVRERSIEKRAHGIAVPPLGDEALVRRGFEVYRKGCALCHGAPGVPPAELATGLHPVPPSLDMPSIQDEGDAELFWVVKNGIKLTGMPAFGAHCSDEEIWAVVAFVRRLPALSPLDYAALEGAGEGNGAAIVEGGVGPLPAAAGDPPAGGREAGRPE